MSLRLVSTEKRGESGRLYSREIEKNYHSELDSPDRARRERETRMSSHTQMERVTVSEVCNDITDTNVSLVTSPAARMVPYS